MFNSVSETGHYLTYSLRKPKKQFEKGLLIVSTDIDVGSSQLGLINKGERDRDVNLSFGEYHIGKVEEISIPMFIETFDAYDIPMTLAVRGQLTDVGGRVLEVLLASKVKHDIGAHGYSHRMFTKLTHDEAEDEMRKISAGMKNCGLDPKSFIFPRNRVAHLDLLEKYRFTCYRSRGGLFKDCMCIEKYGQLYNIYPSIYVNEMSSPFLLKKMLDISIRARSPFHVWFHFWNFGEDKREVAKTIRHLFVPFLQLAKRRQKDGLLTFETMLSAAKKADTASKSNDQN